MRMDPFDAVSFRPRPIAKPDSLGLNSPNAFIVMNLLEIDILKIEN